jgi:hypothetical protein
LVTTRKVTLDVVALGETPPVQPAYSEQLRTPWWWYVIAAFVASILAAEFHIAGIGVTDWLPYAVLEPLALAVVWAMGRARVDIRGDELRVRGGRLSLEYVSGAVALDATTLRRVVGREGDPAAFVSIRPWIGPGVQLWLDDPDDPTPYWVISTRNPDKIVRIIRQRIP